MQPFSLICHLDSRHSPNCVISLQVVVESSNSALEYGDLVVDENSPVNPDLHFDSQLMHLYVMTDRKVRMRQRFVAEFCIYLCAIRFSQQELNPRPVSRIFELFCLSWTVCSVCRGRCVYLSSSCSHVRSRFVSMNDRSGPPYLLCSFLDIVGCLLAWVLSVAVLV
jgi:hypothetical protein